MTAYNSYTDQELTILLKSGDEHAYRQLFDRHWAQTYANIYKRLKDHSKAEDITQDIFMQLWVNRAKVNILNLGAYLYTASRNSVFRSLEQQAKMMPIADMLDDLENIYERTDGHLLTLEFMSAYEALVSALPSGQQTIFRLRYNQDLSPDEIALKLGISVKTVRNQLGKAISTLRSSMVMMLVAIFSVVQK